MKPRLRAKADGTFAWKWLTWLDGLREVDVWVKGYATAAEALEGARQAKAETDRVSALMAERFIAGDSSVRYRPINEPRPFYPSRWAVRLNPRRAEADDGRCYMCRAWPGPSGLCKHCRTPQP